jgi:hypothetical protein
MDLAPLHVPFPNPMVLFTADPHGNGREPADCSGFPHPIIFDQSNGSAHHCSRHIPPWIGTHNHWRFYFTLLPVEKNLKIRGIYNTSKCLAQIIPTPFFPTNFLSGVQQMSRP